MYLNKKCCIIENKLLHYKNKRKEYNINIIKNNDKNRITYSQKTIETMSLYLKNKKSLTKNLKQSTQTYQKTMQDAIEDNKILQY